MNISLSGKVAIVTGASRGLGRAIALGLGKAGAHVVVTDLLVEDEAVDLQKLKDYGAVTEHFAETDHVRTKSTAAEIKEMGSQSLALKMDRKFCSIWQTEDCALGVRSEGQSQRSFSLCQGRLARYAKKKMGPDHQHLIDCGKARSLCPTRIRGE